MMGFQNGSFTNLLVERTGWFLFHALWQIALIALVFALCRAINGCVFKDRPARRAKLNYWFGCCAMALMFVVPLTTAMMQTDGRSQQTSRQATLFPELIEPMVVGSSASRFLELPNPEVSLAEIVALESMPEANEAGWSQQASGLFSSWLAEAGISWQKVQPWCVAIWFLGVMSFSVRPLLGVREIFRLRRSGVEQATPGLIKSGKRIAADLRIPSIDIAISRLAQTPMVAGYLQPVVLLPVSMLSELSTQQIELIIRHELAHVRRHDVLVNLIQIGVESVFFFHPCMWFVSGVVRQERENCCDDIAIENGSPRDYADALLAIEHARQPSLAMASNGGKLLPRIERMFNSGQRIRKAQWLDGLVPVAVLAVMLLVVGLQSNLLAAPQDEVVQHKLIKRNFSKTKLGKALELELRKLDQMEFSGSVLVAHNGEIILVTSEGFADKESETEIKPTSLFEIASITKSYTSTAALILADQGKLDLDASIAKYLPNVPESSESITVRHLMGHKSGIRADSYGDTDKGLEVAVATMLGDGPQSDPGSRFEYWNQGYILLSEIIAKAAGKPFVDVVRELIFEPAKMEGSCFTGDELPSGFTETIGTGSKGPARGALEHPYGSYGLQYRGTGGIVTNVFDMWKFHHALQHGELLSEKSIMQSFDRGVEDSPSPYGLGWFVRELPGGGMCVSHSGRVRGFNGEFRRYPKSDSCIVVLSNSNESPSPAVAGIIEGILFPPDPEQELVAKEVSAFVGSYESKIGRQIHIEEVDGKAVYTVLWSPGVPGGPVSRGYVQRNDKGNLVFYQSNDTSKIRAVFSKDKSKVTSIRYGKDKYTRTKGGLAAGGGKGELGAEEVETFVGSYRSRVGRQIHIEEVDGKAVYTVLWSPGTPGGPVSRGYVRRNDKGKLIFLQSNETTEIRAILSKDKTEMKSIRYGKEKYTRYSGEDAAAAGKKELPDALDAEEARKFVGVYETGFGQELAVEWTQGHLTFAMIWDSAAAKPKKTVGYLMKRKDGKHVLYHPSAPLPIEFEQSEDGEVQSISAKQLNMVFNRQE